MWDWARASPATVQLAIATLEVALQDLSLIIVFMQRRIVIYCKADKIEERLETTSVVISFSKNVRCRNPFSDPQDGIPNPILGARTDCVLLK